MKTEQVQVGKLVTVNDLPDTPVYKVKDLEGNIAQLTYLTGGGKEVSGGAMDISILRKPTKAQLSNSKKEGGFHNE